MDMSREDQNLGFDRVERTAAETSRNPPFYREMADGKTKMLSIVFPPQPDFNSEEMRGSIQAILADNIGAYVVVEFLIGTELIMRKQGILSFVGRSFVTLYDDQTQEFIVCVKFVYFYLPGNRPKRNYNALPPNSIGTANRNYRNDR